MSRQLPVPLRSGGSQPRARVERPEVIVLGSGDTSPSRSGAVARLLLSLTPDLLRAIERSVAQRAESRPAPPATRPEQRAYRSTVQFSEVEYDMRMPFVRKVTVRKASAWLSDLPFNPPEPDPVAQRGGKLRRAGLLSVGGAVALTALGLLANRAGGWPGLGSRRGF